MFEFVNKIVKTKKKAPPDAERHPINLPEVPADKFNAASLIEMLNAGTVIWAWFSILDKPNTDAGKMNLNNLMYMRGTSLDGITIIRKEGKLLCQYVVVVNIENQQHTLLLTDVYLMNNSNIVEMYNDILKDAYKVYYDDEGLTEGMTYVVHDVTEKMALEKLATNRVFHVGEEHYLKKEDAADAEAEGVEK